MEIFRKKFHLPLGSSLDRSIRCVHFFRKVYFLLSTEKWRYYKTIASLANILWMWARGSAFRHAFLIQNELFRCQLSLGEPTLGSVWCDPVQTPQPTHRAASVREGVWPPTGTTTTTSHLSHRSWNYNKNLGNFDAQTGKSGRRLFSLYNKKFVLDFSRFLTNVRVSQEIKGLRWGFLLLSWKLVKF